MLTTQQTETNPTANQKSELPSVMVHLPEGGNVYRRWPGCVKKFPGIQSCPEGTNLGCGSLRRRSQLRALS